MNDDHFIWTYLKQGLSSKGTLQPWDTAMSKYISETEVYSTWFLFNDDGKKWIENNGGTKGLAGARLPVSTHFIAIDIDSEYNVLSALEQARRLSETIVKQVDVQPDLWFSGSKGFHVNVPVKDAIEPCPHLPAILKEWVNEMCSIAKVHHDTSIYHQSRVLRLPYTQHGKSGLYKIPVTVDMSYNDILERAKYGQAKD